MISQIQSLAGSLNQEVALSDDPDSINAQYGNCCFLPSYSPEMAAAAHKLFFADFNASESAPAAPRGSVLNLNEYIVYGECNEEIQQNFTNYGCKIISCAEIGDEEVPEEVNGSRDKMVIQCSKSKAAISEFAGDQGVKIL